MLGEERPLALADGARRLERQQQQSRIDVHLYARGRQTEELISTIFASSITAAAADWQIEPLGTATTVRKRDPSGALAQLDNLMPT